MIRATLVGCLRQLDNAEDQTDEELFSTGMNLLEAGFIKLIHDPDSGETRMVANPGLEIINYGSESLH